MPGQITPQYKTNTPEKITLLLQIGKLAIDLDNEKKVSNIVKNAYRCKLKKSGKDFKSLMLDDDAYTYVIKFTQHEFKAYQAAKRKVYNAQRRLDSACRKAALTGVLAC